MFSLYFDWTMILLIPGILFALWAQNKVKSTFAKWSRVMTSKNITGLEIAKMILNSKGLNKIPVNLTRGKLSDNYNPINRTLNLSNEVYNSSSVAAAGVAAHEAGHAIQHNRSYAPLLVRNGIFPVARFGSWLAFPLVILGLIFSIPPLVKIGIWVFAGFVAFTVITLPVEFDASKRAVRLLAGSGYFNEREIIGVKEVLNAAALTYVAAALSAILNLVRLLILSGRRN